ncbi:MAG: endonuclease/exonuclease/phosphatase family protein [Pseudomonadota bacterium]
MLRVVTLNTWKCDGEYGPRLALMSRELARLDADVLCLQECFAVCADDDACMDGVHRIADTGKTLAEALGMRLFHAPAREKQRTANGDRVRSTSGLVLLLRSQMAVGVAEVLDLLLDPRDGDRIAQSVTVRLPGAPALRIVNLHLTHLRDRDDLRPLQLDAVLARWDPTDVPVLLAGDFNATFDSAPLSALRDRTDLDIGPVSPERWPTTMMLGPSSRAIDHVLLLRGAHDSTLRIQDRRRVLDCADSTGLFPSDHAGVLVELEMRRSVDV